MSTLLLRLAAPLQSWGVDSKYENRRNTERVPSKSGIIGLIAAALGRRRNESIKDLEELRFGVRVDREGMLLRDYHTVKGSKPYVTNRYYLMNAVFLAGLEGDEELLREIEFALRRPRFPLFLGRRSCPPEGRLLLGIRSGKTLLEALREEPWQVNYCPRQDTASEVSLRIVMDAGSKEKNGFFQRDVPISFAQTCRKFGFRMVSELEPVIIASGVPEPPTNHDPMIELGVDS